MKITKTQLRKIIKEEVSKVLSEEMSPMEFLDHTIKIIEDYVKKGMLTQAMLNDALELKKEGKLPSHTPVKFEAKKPRNWFVYLRIKLQTWLFSRLLRMVSKR